ncbi:hypothetical protein C2G38_2274877 [Gigaspora rosea]|uniref:Uncharacterized protein n=1 Tax=Gigaspora rosea TaxID=44941 RepID=A0A397W2J6_9GLOM|nr:hypothetical protein C2G38_2274877 [Gigaspora rosea]
MKPIALSHYLKKKKKRRNKILNPRTGTTGTKNQTTDQPKIFRRNVSRSVERIKTYQGLLQAPGPKSQDARMGRPGYANKKGQRENPYLAYTEDPTKDEDYETKTQKTSNKIILTKRSIKNETTTLEKVPTRTSRSTPAEMMTTKRSLEGRKNCTNEKPSRTKT